MYDVSIAYSPVDSTLLKSMINLSGAQSRDDFFTFVVSQKLNNAGTLTEMYQVLRGMGISDVTISVKDGQLVEVTSNWVANTLSQWATTSGMTTPTFASALSAVPWSSTTTGTSPLTFNGVQYDVRSFTAKINQNPDRVQVVGQNTTTWIQQTTREVTLDMEIVYKDTSVSTDAVNLTPRAMTFQLNSTGPTTLTFTDVYLEKYDEDLSADSTKAKTVSYSGFAASVVLT